MWFCLLLAAHELEVVHLLQLGDDELAAHVGHLHLQLGDLEVAQLHLVADGIDVVLGSDPPAIKERDHSAWTQWFGIYTCRSIP